ncbi:phosphotransferase [Nocardioides sp.]|uniref:phosphotransferase n=1 Tax=Nocardioides sp. TaxID=35761 RepID=UPI002735AAEB|nr:phosphotransferase [Nocardioides sp.]MDP3894774.1 phosphotransferase [Nocardioides sp.]
MDGVGGIPGSSDGTATAPTTADAVSASVACARALGLPADNPEVIAEGYSVRVRLRPAAVVTRVVTVGRALRPEPLPWLQREVAVAQFLASSGLPVVAPWEDPGPHIAEGLEVSLWQWAEHDSGTVTAADFGAMLGQLHTALVHYPGDLPTLVGPLTDIATAQKVSSDPTLHRAAAELLPLALSWPRRPLHGDAHTGNVLMTPTGPHWTDFEDVCVGPVEWDMASMTITEDAVSAYPGTIDRTRLADCRDLRRLQILASLLVGNYDDPALYDTLVSHLDKRSDPDAR